ncbi:MULTISPECIES: SAM-dependent methyltransferase [unclassified Nocardia]|uniref:SAM-dependent methyltransferase n=1 Tax=unclassified Nocardia TaxID=2637762 RepID=UPI001CE3C9DA|nr:MULTISPECIES: SAM-dependent methyltransferase [unclassified Nocardia]
MSLQFRPDRAHSGRIHDFLLDGKDHYLIDRIAGRALEQETGEFRLVVRTARQFLIRAVGCLAAEYGVRQFVELGSGYPCSPNVHDAAQAVDPDIRTLYVDNDPVVAAHGRALLANSRTHIVHADLTHTDTIVDAIAEFMNPGQPQAICLGFVCEFLAEPAAVTKALTSSLPAGSYLVLSHITADPGSDIAKRAAVVYGEFGIEFRPRTRGEVGDLLAGTDLLEPGLVPPHRWRPGSEPDQCRAQRPEWAPERADKTFCYAAVGRIG